MIFDLVGLRLLCISFIVSPSNNHVYLLMAILYIWFLVAIFAVFLIPGKTNILLAHTAHHKGIIPAIALLPAEYLGYCYAIGLWSLLLHLTSPFWIYLDQILHAFSIVYVLWMSFRLWRTDTLEKRHININKLSSSAIFYTTLRNPKAILFSVGVLPASTWLSSQHYFSMMFLLGLLMIPSALCWIIYGKTQLAHGRGEHTKHFYQISAFLLILCVIPVIARFFVIQ